MGANTMCFIGIILLVLIAIVSMLITNQSKAHGTDDSAREGFVLTSQPATVSPVTGAIVGQGIMTNQMTRMPLDEMTKQVNSNGFVYDGDISIGVGVGNGFDTLYNNQLDIQAIDDKAVGGYQQRSDLSDISQKIASSSNNANNNLFTRAGSTPTKLYIAPNEVRCVIDEKYLPERDKNRQVATVGTVIPTQGYDLNIERIGEALTGTHFSSFSANGKRKRIPTAAGATTSKGTESPVGDVIDNEVEINGDNLKINNTIAGGADVTAPMSQDSGAESFRKKYVKNLWVWFVFAEKGEVGVKGWGDGGDEGDERR